MSGDDLVTIHTPARIDVVVAVVHALESCHKYQRLVCGPDAEGNLVVSVQVDDKAES